MIEKNIIRIINRRVFLVLILLFIGVSFGTIGYILIENVSFLDALYMSVITLSTVGYGESIELSEKGRIFTIILILTNIGLLGLMASILARFVVDLNLSDSYARIKMKKAIEELENHVIVCGFGRNGAEACKYFSKFGQPFVVIEKNIENLHLANSNEYLTVKGDATLDEILEKAGIHRAKAIVSTLSEDTDNVFVALTARSFNPEISIISRASSDSAVKKLRIAGANNVIMPDKIGGIHMARLAQNADILEFLDSLVSFQNDGLSFEEIDYENLNEISKGKTIGELVEGMEWDLKIIGVRTADGKFEINPSKNYLLESNTKLFILAYDIYFKEFVSKNCVEGFPNIAF